MNTEQALQRTREVVRRKHLTLSTEEVYCAWLRRYCEYIKQLAPHTSSEQKLERFLTALAREDVSASTQNQAFNAIVFFDTQVLGVELTKIHGLRAKRPVQLRLAPSREDTFRLLKAVQSDADFDVALAVRLLYGCGLRVTEPLNLRIKDVNLEGTHFVIRGAKGGKDRVVQIPCAVIEEVREEVESARLIW